MSTIDSPPTDRPILPFAAPADFAAWLAEHHATSPGIWLRIAKAGSGIPSVTYAEALDEALCYGWIDGQKKSLDAETWLQKFTPRGPKSVWSKINRDKVAALEAAGRMRPAGRAAVESARSDGRWDAAYDSARTAEVPADLQAALDANDDARTFFGTLNSANRYAVLWRVQTAKRPETRAKRITDLVAMLGRGEKLHR